MPRRTVLVTGASGFVGRALVKSLVYSGHFEVRASVRTSHDVHECEADVTVVREVGPISAWGPVLDGVDCIMHCAARVHVTMKTPADALSDYRSVNVGGTRRLADEAAVRGVRRLVFLSSIKVNGEETEAGVPFSASDPARPFDSYALSKWEAEEALREVAAATGIEVVVIRSPMIYGPGVKGNLQRLLGLIARGVVLPVGRVRNQRSMIGIDNLVDLLIKCVDHPAAVGETFLVSDGEDLSTPELVGQLATAMGRPPRLLPVPITLLRTAGQLLGKAPEVSRLVGSLQVNGARAREVLGWVPPVSVQDGLEATVKAYQQQP